MIGLYNYLAAHNIRQKVKHPLFLALKFDKCFFIYYDPIQIPALACRLTGGQKIQQFFPPSQSEFQASLLLHYSLSGDLREDLGKLNKVTAFVCVLETSNIASQEPDPEKIEKISQIFHQKLVKMLESSCSNLHMLYSRGDVPAHYVQMRNKHLMEKAVTAVFEESNKEESSMLGKRHREENNQDEVTFQKQDSGNQTTLLPSLAA